MSEISFSKKSKLYLALLICVSAVTLFFCISIFLKSSFDEILKNGYRKDFVLTAENLPKWEDFPGQYNSPIKMDYTFLEHLEFDESKQFFLVFFCC